MNEFDKIFERIKEVTDIKNMVQLAKVVSTVPSNVSKKRKEDKFSVEWAYKVGKKYGVLTEWIVTGEGPKSLDQSIARKTELISGIEKWILDKENNLPGALIWFDIEFKRKFPEFEEWIEKAKYS